MRRHHLLEHMRSHANLAGACPVCAAPSGGNQHYFSKNLYGHLMLRHKTDIPIIPQTILKEQQALKESLEIAQTKQISPNKQAPRPPGQPSQPQKATAKESEKQIDKKSNDQS